MTLVHRERSSFFGQEESRTRIGPFEWFRWESGGWAFTFALGPFRQPGISLHLSVSHGYTDPEPCGCPPCVARREVEEGNA